MPPQRSVAFVAPALATRVDAVPLGDDWLHEPKLDGYRIQCHVMPEATTLFTRNGLDWSTRFPSLVAATRQMVPAGGIVFDGEVVAPASHGDSSFQSLQRSLTHQATQSATYWVFDLLMYDGLDLRPLPLTTRRDTMQRILEQHRRSNTIRMTRLLRGAPHQLLATACSNGMEGIISKRRDGAYPRGRSRDWLKIKCGKQDEFVVIGYTQPQGHRSDLGALLLATRSPGDPALQYAGRVGTGFDTAMRRLLVTRLQRRAEPPVQLPRIDDMPPTVQWVEPVLVVQVTFTEWTAEGRLRHAVFTGIREDKTMREVERETAVMIAEPGISHGERIVFPDVGVTKSGIVDYLRAVAPLMLPHIAGRPLSLLRCPDGAAKDCFFQKHWKPGQGVATTSTTEGDGSLDAYAVVSRAEDLVALAQQNVLEIHAWQSHITSVERPDQMILDLDPGPGVAWCDVRDAAMQLRDLLDGVGLECWVKLTGGKGLHVIVPLRGAVTWEQLSLFAKLVASRLAHDEPKRFTTTMAKRARRGRILIDWLRNTRGATAVAPWSMRARQGAPIAMPVLWTELAHIARGDLMTLPEVMAFLSTSPDDPWRDMLKSRQRLTSACVEKIGAGVGG